MLLRTKVEVLILVSMLVILSVGSALSVNRYITPSSDDVDTFIKNSNGKYWSATEANLQTALWDLNYTGGTVWVGDDLTLTSAIEMGNDTKEGYENVILDFQGHTVNMGADCDFLLFQSCRWCAVRDVYIKTDNMTSASAVLHLYVDSGGSQNRIRFNEFENIHGYDTGTGDSNDYIAIHLDGGNSNILYNTFHKMTFYGAGHGINLSNNGSSYINGNYFEDIFIPGSYCLVEFWRPSGNIEFNYFEHVYGNADEDTYWGFRNITNTANMFINCFVWDWGTSRNASASSYDWIIQSGASQTQIWSCHISNLSDNGQYSIAFSPTTNYPQVVGGWFGNENLVPWTNASVDNSATDEYVLTWEDSSNSMHWQAESAGSGGISNMEYIIEKRGDFFVAVDGDTGSEVYNNTNAHTTFESALGDANLFVRSGTYNFSNKIDNNLGERYIVGENPHDTIFTWDDGATADTGIIYTGENAANIYNGTIKNIQFIGNDAGTTNPMGINLREAYNWEIDNCIFEDFNDGSSCYGINLYDTAVDTDFQQNVSITNCEFYNCYYGIGLRRSTDHCIVFNCKIYDSVTTGITLVTDAHNNTISNNQIIATTGVSIGAGCQCNNIVCNNLISCGTAISDSGGNTGDTGNMK